MKRPEYIGIITINPYGMNERLSFGPFYTYSEADEFIQKKFHEYEHGVNAYVDGLISPVFRSNHNVT